MNTLYQNTLDTGRFGGADHPSVDELVAMQQGDYVLHAKGGKLHKVQVEKARLPRDPVAHGQGMGLSRAADGTIYLDTGSMLHKSNDEGRTWTSKPCNHPPVKQNDNHYWFVTPRNTLVCETLPDADHWLPEGSITIWESKDEGQTIACLTEFHIDMAGTPHEGGKIYTHFHLHQLSDGSLVFGFDPRTTVMEEIDGKTIVTAGSCGLYLLHSQDGGQTWQGPNGPVPWGPEGGITILPSGKWFGSFRYQRPRLMADPPNIAEIAGNDSGYPWKHVFIAESDDRGQTWRNYRRLTTYHGQCLGRPAALSDGTVIVMHDTRYGPGEPSGRVMISRDEGQTWQDEMYYMYYGRGVSGYPRHLVMDDDTILSVVPTIDEPEARTKWNAMVGNTDFTVIRWKP